MTNLCIITDNWIIDKIVKKNNHSFDTVQLVSQRSLRCAFLDYIEGDVTFNPTYKYDPGTDNWDSR